MNSDGLPTLACEAELTSDPLGVSAPMLEMTRMKCASSKRMTVAFGGMLLLFPVECSVTPAAADKVESNQQRVRVVKNVTYLGKGRSEKLDLYLPAKQTDSRRAAVVSE